MKDKLLSHFQKIGPRRFVIGCVILLIFLDLVNGYCFKLYWEVNDMSYQAAMQAFRKYEVHGDIKDSTLKEVIELVNMSVDFFLTVVLINNLFFYFFYLRKKLWAQGYVLFYTLTAGLMNLMMLLEASKLGWEWFIFNLLNIPLYLYLFAGVKLLKNETTIPVPEKKAR